MVTIHTIGDLFVPLSMEQIYARRARAGHVNLLVQRAIRDHQHCGFAVAEEEGPSRLVNWVTNAVKPAGDDILKPAVVADPKFGCNSRCLGTLGSRPADLLTTGPWAGRGHRGVRQRAPRCRVVLLRSPRRIP